MFLSHQLIRAFTTWQCSFPAYFPSLYSKVKIYLLQVVSLFLKATFIEVSHDATALWSWPTTFGLFHLTYGSLVQQWSTFIQEDCFVLLKT